MILYIYFRKEMFFTFIFRFGFVLFYSYSYWICINLLVFIYLDFRVIGVLEFFGLGLWNIVKLIRLYRNRICVFNLICVVFGIS